MSGTEPGETLSLCDLQLCFEGAIPAVIATADASGQPNITYLSRVRRIDDERVALSNQFFSKTSRNLVENPRASVLLADPTTYIQYRLSLVYERTERQGAVFERLREDVDAIAAISGMQHVFKLRTADIYRVTDIEPVRTETQRDRAAEAPTVIDTTPDTGALAELVSRLGRSRDLDTLLSATVDGLDELLGYPNSLVLLLDETGKQLYTIASHGYEVDGVGSEIALGEGVIGMAAARCAPMRLGNLRHMARYSRAIRTSFDEAGIGPGHVLPVPDRPQAQSRLAVPAMAAGQLLGVVVVESDAVVAFDEADESILTIVASVVANAIDADRAWARVDDDQAGRARPGPVARPTPAAATHVRFFAVDGSTFLGGNYLIKGVAGRILWSLLGQHDREGQTEFTNREVRLDPTLELPEFRDNLESRLILLKRRLDEREAPIRIEKIGRGRFRLLVDTELRLEEVVPPS